MQTTTPTFQANADADLRHLWVKLAMSFEKTFDDDVTFFTLDTSLLDGPDVLAPTEDDVIQAWDKYAYIDYSGRVIRAEWSSQFDPIASVSLSMCDLVLRNEDGFFTPGAGSAIDNFILPRRPVRLYAGFRGETVPVFVGLTEGLPKLDKQAGTAVFHCVDFLDSLFNRKLDETVMLTDVRTDEVLDYLLQELGLLPAQFDLDQGMNNIAFFFAEKGDKFGDIARELMEAELGRLYMNETGMIVFRNRQNFPTTSTKTFNSSNIVSLDRHDTGNLINVVEVTAEPRAVQAKQPIWQLSEAVRIENSSTVEIWADFQDPVTTVDEPGNGLASLTSYFIARTGSSDSDPLVGSGITVTDADLFAKSYKLTLSNASGSAVYITDMEIWGTPAKVVNKIYVREQDDDSVAKYDEQVRTIENNFLQTEAAAGAVARSLLYRYSEYGTTFDMSVKGTPAQQINDAITVNLEESGVYNITKQENIIGDGRYEQRLLATFVPEFVFFTLDQSILDGPDILAP